MVLYCLSCYNSFFHSLFLRFIHDESSFCLFKMFNEYNIIYESLCITQYITLYIMIIYIPHTHLCVQLHLCFIPLGLKWSDIMVQHFSHFRDNQKNSVPSKADKKFSMFSTVLSNFLPATSFFIFFPFLLSSLTRPWVWLALLELADGYV